MKNKEANYKKLYFVEQQLRIEAEQELEKERKAFKWFIEEITKEENCKECPTIPSICSKICDPDNCTSLCTDLMIEYARKQIK